MYQAIEFMAVVTSGIYGILQARSARMDALGIITVAFAAAFGGGTLRDLFLDRHPLFWIANSHYAITVFCMAVVSCLIPRLPMGYKKWLNLPDALGLGLFSIIGTQFALQAETPAFVAVLLGVITGTFGGVISDVLCARVPSLFRSAPLYATCSFAGCWLFIGAVTAGMSEGPAIWLGIASIVATRFAALYWNWSLPEIHDK